ncbi:MAG TPA: hypothetical protein VFP94_09680 [Terriglobales bacterium]|nr:hypothetical protein [Terriglobales bacterium]
MKRRAVAVLAALTFLVALPLLAQDPASSADHPPGNVNELTLAGLQPGSSRLATAEARWGKQWTHPDADERDVYVWCDAHSRLRISLEAGGGTVRVVTVEHLRDKAVDTRHLTRVAPDGRPAPWLRSPAAGARSAPGASELPRAGGCMAHLPASVAHTGRGVRLGASEAQLLHAYGKPFFSGPSSLDGHNVKLVVFNFSWAGSDKPQILESTFNAAGKLVKMTLSAEYY